MLFTPLRLRGLELANRIVMSPMCQYSAVDGVPTAWHRTHLVSRAVGGVGAVVVEASAVAPEGRISPADSGLWNEAQMQAWASIAAEIRTHGAAVGIQLAHAGRKASTAAPWDGGAAMPATAGGWQPLAPSALPFNPADPAPQALDAAQIDTVVDQFVSSAGLALRADFDFLELHMAHGYLLHSFMSPLANHREDAYGGSLENRMRLPLRVFSAVRDAWPDDRPILVRISATDWAPGGWDLEQSIALSRALRERGADLVDCSSGGLVPDARIQAGPGYQVAFAAAVRQAAGIPTAAVGLITEPAQAEQIVRSGQADLVMLARGLLRDPYWALRAGSELRTDGRWPQQYLRARPSSTG
jgi:NADH:flavin oxidoreductases, Old Yellow Enzyme family